MESVNEKCGGNLNKRILIKDQIERERCIWFNNRNNISNKKQGQDEEGKLNVIFSNFARNIVYHS